jgi:NAD(P)-dependent dehydrogenase (short-subunit alcohol dehydrogenase family)
MTDTVSRVAVVTGASSGIGEATARALAAEGYRVALLARRVDRITALADELGDGSIALAADVTDRDSVVAAADRVQQELGGLDVLVNNAGVMLLGPFATDRRDDYRQMIEVNLLGAITATEVFLDQLRAPPAPATASTPPPSGASTAGRSRCARSCSPTYASRSSSPASSPPSCRPTSPTPRPRRASSSCTTPPRSPPATSPRSSRSPSAGRGTSPSTRSCCARPDRPRRTST